LLIGAPNQQLAINNLNPQSTISIHNQQSQSEIANLKIGSHQSAIRI